MQEVDIVLHNKPSANGGGDGGGGGVRGGGGGRACIHRARM